MKINRCLDKYGNTLTLGDLVSIDLLSYKETFTILEIEGTEEKARLTLRKCIGATPFGIDAAKVYWVHTYRLLKDEE